jgi:hypothetical protein
MDLLKLLEKRFNDHPNRHESLKWREVEKTLKDNPSLLNVIQAMEESGGDPDVVILKDGNPYYVDCSKETPMGRRSVCYDTPALKSRKKHPPKTSARAMAKAMGASLLNEEDYLAFQSVGPFDTKTSSWLETPESLRMKGGALFGDSRYGRAFIYHNGAESYYQARGFRTKILLESSS